jgi:hypothetical protein
MSELWTGNPPNDPAPTIEPIVIDTDPKLDPGATLTARAPAGDRDGDDVEVYWVLRPESGEYQTGGDFRRDLPDIEGAVVDWTDGEAKIRMPDEPGPYRLFAYAFDEAGNAATANIPLLVKGEPRPLMPVAVYEDRLEDMPWVPSGWMGDVKQLTLDGDHGDTVFEGSHAIRMRFTGRSRSWVGVAWQHPPNNWGEQDGGFNLTGATRLEIWARGEYGGEKVEFGVGILGRGREHKDSAIVKTRAIELTDEWRRYDVPLDGEDLTSLKTALVVTVHGRRSPVTVYLDSIRFNR